MGNLTVQKIFLALVTLGAFVASPWITSELLEGNSTPFILVLGVGGLLIFLYVLKDNCWMMIPFCLAIEGRFNFLPANFSMLEFATLMVLAYVIIQIVMGRQVLWRLGPAILWVPLAGLLSILLYHWISSGDIGIRVLGGSGWGGRKYVTISIACLSYFLILAFSGDSPRKFQWIPLLYFVGTFFDIIPQGVTTLYPSLAPYVFKFYSGVNLTEYGSYISSAFSGESSVTRIRQFSQVGTGLLLLLMCYRPIPLWLTPSNLWTIPLLIVSFFATAFSGFRSAIFNYFIAAFAGSYAYLRLFALLILPIIPLVAAFVALTNQTLIHYPQSIQRTLSFLPGNWEARALLEAESSSKWRQKIRELFFAEYFQKSSWIGLGYSFDPMLALRATDVYLQAAAMRENDPYEDTRPFIEMRQPHEGDIHAMLVSGTAGLAFFSIFCLSSLVFVFGFLRSVPVRQVLPIHVWTSAVVAQQTLGFFLLFGDYSNMLPQILPALALLIAYRRCEESARPVSNPPAPGGPPPAGL